MRWLPLAIGLTSVLQATCNRRMMRVWDVLTVTAWNSVLILVVCAALLLLRHALGPPPGSLFAERFALSALRPEFVVPPLASVCFMAAMPIAVAHVGASRAFPLLIAGQLGMSILWDLTTGDASVNATRALGAALALAGAAIANRE